MALLGRIVVIIFAAIVASFAADVTIAAGLLGPGWHSLSGNPGERIVFWSLVAVGGFTVGGFALLPLVIAIVLTESFNIRSLIAYAAGGALMLLIGYYASGLSRPSYEESIDRPPPPISHEAEIAAASGAVFGFVYWVIAGRKAGRWREKSSV